MGELLPCPFCGHAAKTETILTTTVCCSHCKARGPLMPTGEHTFETARDHDTVTAWNTRPRTEGRGEGEPVASIARRVLDATSQDIDGYWFVGGEDPEELLAELATALDASPIRETEISREAVARIIDPEAWEEYLLEDGRVDEEVASIFRDAYETSLIKADAILNLAPVGGRGEGWRPISEAPRDGTYILAHLADRDADDRWAHLAGRTFVVRHEGKTSSGYDLGWSVHPGFGGCADDWFSGWQPLPPPPQEQGGMK